MTNFIKYYHIGILLFSLLIISCTYTPTDLEIENLKGKVISTKVTRYKAVEKFGEVVPTDKIERVEITTFNDAGYKTSWKEYGRSGNEYAKKIWTLNDDNIVTEYKSFEFGDLKESFTYVIEDNKQLSYTKEYYEDWRGVVKESKQGTYYYDSSNNRPTKEIIKIYSIKNNSPYYDDFIDTVCVDTTIIDSIVPISNNKNICLEDTISAIEKHYTYYYTDKYGSRVIELLEISEKDTVKIDTFYIEQYNKDYRPILIYDDRDWNYHPNQYNEKGDLEIERGYIKYSYLEFDEKNNWTKRVIYDNEEVEYIEEREIIYK